MVYGWKISGSSEETFREFLQNVSTSSTTSESVVQGDLPLPILDTLQNKNAGERRYYH